VLLQTLGVVGDLLIDFFAPPIASAAVPSSAVLPPPPPPSTHPKSTSPHIYGSGQEEGLKRTIRSAHIPLPKKSLILDRQNLADALGETCCTKQCMANLTLSQLEAVRTRWIGLGSQEAQFADLLSFFEKSKTSDGSIHYHIGDGKSICRQAFLIVHGKGQGGLSDATLDKARHEAGFGNKNKHALPVKLEPFPRERPQHDHVFTWLTNYCRDLAPVAEDQKGHAILHLHSNLEWTDLYREFVRDFERQSGAGHTPSEPTFQQVRRSEFTYLHQPYVGEYGVCSLCFELTENIRSATTRMEEEEAKKEKEMHQKEFRNERSRYNADVQYAKENPALLHFVSIDQSASRYIPHLVPCPTSLTRKHKLELLKFLLHLQPLFCICCES
jgi:hypothetical protein